MIFLIVFAVSAAQSGDSDTACDLRYSNLRSQNSNTLIVRLSSHVRQVAWTLQLTTVRHSQESLR